MKQNKARRLTEHLDEKYVLMAAYPEAVFRKHRHGLLMKRILIVAACVAILAVGMVAVLLPALRSDPGVATDPPETQSPLSPDAEWVADPTIVKVTITPDCVLEGAEPELTRDADRLDRPKLGRAALREEYSAG